MSKGNVRALIVGALVVVFFIGFVTVMNFLGDEVLKSYEGRAGSVLKHSSGEVIYTSEAGAAEELTCDGSFDFVSCSSADGATIFSYAITSSRDIRSGSSGNRTTDYELSDVTLNTGEREFALTCPYSSFEMSKASSFACLIS